MSLKLEGLSKTFGSFTLQSLNLTIPQGEFFSVLGPSGCGKTTLLRLIGGFESPTGGKIFLNERELTQLPPYKRNIHTVFQRYALFPHLDVFENVAFSLRLKKVSNAVINDKVDSILETVEISSLKRRMIHQLSGGQAQRAALARALVDHPDVLLLDEPLSALDPALRIKMRDELKLLNRKVKTTFIIVTHDQEEALQLSDRMAILKDGACLQIGTPKSIYEDPKDVFVAQFIGPSNLIDGDLSEENGETYTDSGHGKLKIKKNGVELPRSVSLLLRPEKMRLLRQKSSQHDNVIEAEICSLSYLGSRTEYLVKADKHFYKIFEQENERSKKRLLNTGDRIFIAWKAEDAILFPRIAP